MDFKPYYNDWLDITSLFSDNADSKFNLLKVNLDINFFKNLRFDKDSLKSYRINAALKSSEVLGNKPALCFSGGVDSQAMLQCWLESGLKFDVYTLVFTNGFNDMDYELARNICNKVGVKLKEIEIDVIKFLNFYNYDYATKYNSASPHFNVHYKLFDIIKSYGHTGVCAGGDVPYKNLSDNSWGNNFSKSPNNFYEYANINQYPTIGNFLGYTPELAWITAIMTLPAYYPNKHSQWVDNTTYWAVNAGESIISDYEKRRYLQKCSGYRNTGFDIIEQKEKYTGFEKVKKFLENLTGNGWEFENRYRHNIQKMLKFRPVNSQFVFNTDTKYFLDSLFNDKHAAI